jgi:hypothetical protein
VTGTDEFFGKDKADQVTVTAVANRQLTTRRVHHIRSDHTANHDEREHVRDALKT